MLLICGCVAGLITNLVPMLTDKGLPRTEAAGYASLVGISVIVGRLVAGYLIDHFWAPAIAFVFLIAPALTCVVLTGDVTPGLLTIVVPLIGLAAGAELDMMAFFAVKYFGLRNYGAIYGVQFGFFAIGSGFAPAIFGAVFDSFGGYGPILWISAGAFVVGAFMLLTMGRYPNFGLAKA
jgi:sugar phosphate permease